MKYLYYFLGLLALLLLIYLGLCALGPKNFDTVANTSIKAPAAVIFNMVNDLKQSSDWGAWAEQDTSMKTTFSDMTSGVGATSNWESEKLGNGQQKIVESTPFQKVKTELKFDGWGEANFADFNLQPEGDETNVSWNFESGSNLPFLLRGVMLVNGGKKRLEEDYKKGLANLKRSAEERAGQGIYNGYKIKELVLDEKNFVINRQEVDLSKIQQYYTSNLGPLFTKVQTAGVQMSGMPCGLFFNYDVKNSKVDMAAAIPVETPVNIDGAKAYQIPSRRAIQVDYFGDYGQTSRAHEAIDLYMKDKGYLQDVPSIEEYVTDPTQEKDPEKWLTRVTYYFSERG